MKITLSKEDIIKLVYNAFVDGGMRELQICDVKLIYSDKDYSTARNQLKQVISKVTEHANAVCYEDILMELFKGNKLQVKDNYQKKTYLFTPQSVAVNLHSLFIKNDKNSHHALNEILDSLMEDGDADAITQFNILQYMIFKEVIYS